MKVLHLGKFDTLGGIERHVKALASGLAATEGTVVINLVSSNSRHSEHHLRYGYPTIAAASWGTLFSVALSPSLPALARKLQRETRFDIVHLHFPDPLGHLTALYLPRAVKRVISWHSDIIRQQRALMVYGPFVRRFIADADAVIGATPQHLISSQIPPGKATQARAVVPYGFDPAQLAWNPAAEARSRALQEQFAGKPIVFALGRHVYYKGFDVLIRAMRDIDAQLVLGGIGPLTNSLRQQAADGGVQSRVHFAGHIPEDELVAYYDACDVFVLPSTDRGEAFGLVQLEAMYRGKPVVATRLVTGVEYVNRDGETGLLVEPRDPAALAAAVNRLLGDPGLRARLGTAGRERVARKFSIAQMIDKTLDVYRAVLDPQRARSGDLQ